IGVKKFDDEGRVITAEYPKLIVVNVYVPHGRRDLSRLSFKMEFHEKILNFLNKLRKKGKKIVICGDFNVAHNEIDIARPKANKKNTGFLPEERAWVDRFLESGYVDTFRYLHPETVKYTFWDVKSRARERNVGWRIDYIFLPKSQINSVKNAFILTEVAGSDHCPAGIKIKI
ncbi:MAG TPA: exodeoxyribonuclease III, partial [Candidatus Woesearchaeota archaeon]|nr:exodeoxyribonuclease III [Candidatus Woesearchaeota archaeon]